MTRKDFINCADAISNLIISGQELNQIIAEFIKVFSDKYNNFDPTIFRQYIVTQIDEKRRERIKLPNTSKIKLIE